ncbi:MAG: hypothetical protein RSB99_00350 [Bacilli bacterium]
MLRLVLATKKADLVTNNITDFTCSSYDKQNILEALSKCEKAIESGIYIRKCLFLVENSTIKIGCYLDAATDIKFCTLNIIQEETEYTEVNQMLKLATTYSLDNLMMETVCFQAPKDNKIYLNAALENNFLLDDLEDNHTETVCYLKDRTLTNVKNSIR